MKRALKESIGTKLATLGLSGLIIAVALASAIAQKKYDPGVTDTEIKIGNIMPYSGPLSAYGVSGRAEARDPMKSASLVARDGTLSHQGNEGEHHSCSFDHSGRLLSQTSTRDGTLSSTRG